jgi:hypothetical protein
MRLLVVFVTALATTLTPLASTYAIEECCDDWVDCGEQRAYQNELCSDCIVCVTGLCCVLPADSFVVGGSPCVIGRLDWPARVGELRNDPPPLPPPRHPERTRENS